MDLILWRHAEAEIGEPDLGRKLTARGEKQARRMAQWLHAHLPDSTRILVSPATRAQQTAQALVEISHRKLKTVDALQPGAGVDELLAAADWPKARVPVLVVGHQPTLGAVACHLMTGGYESWSVKKAAIWWLAPRDRDGSSETVLRAVVNPDLA